MPENNNTTQTLRELIDDCIEQRIRQLHTWRPAIVDSYDADKQLVDVTPQTMRFRVNDDGSLGYEALPSTYSVPVGFFGAGKFRGPTLPIVKGTTGVLLYCEGGLDEWLATGGGSDPVNPKTNRLHALTDAIFIPILKPNANAFTDAGNDEMTMGKDGGAQVVITENGIELGGNPSDRPTDLVALAPATKGELSKLRDAMNAGFAAVRANDQKVSSHTHTVDTAGTAVKQSGTTAASLSLATLSDPQDADMVGEIASTNVKSK